MTTTCLAPRCGAQAEVGAMFCLDHMKAPSGQRGGWLSVAMRRAKLAGGTMLDASPVTKRLWIGGQPPFDRDLDFDVLVLCAQELQPKQLGFTKTLIRCPLPDAHLANDELRRALLSAKKVAAELAKGKKVLVTCFAGRNRSALVSGLAMGLVHHMNSDDIITRIRALRNPNALSNTHFQEILRRFIGDGIPR